MSRVNLLPPELLQRQATRRQTTIVALVGVGVLAIIGVFFFAQTVRLSGAKQDLADQQTRNGQLNGRISQLQPFANLQQLLQAKKQLVTTVFQNEISWSGVLLDVSRVIPNSAYLTNLNGSVTAATGQAPAAPSSESTLIGNVSFSGVADHTETIATWLTSLEEVKGWVNPWVTSATETAAQSQIYQFGSGVDLTTQAATSRGRGGQQ